MMHVLLQYPEVYSDLAFTSISTLPLELRCTTRIGTDNIQDDVEDGTFTTTVSQHVRSGKTNFPAWRKHTYNETLILDDLKQSGLGYDKVTQFSLRPCELKPIIKKVGDYFRWFYIEMDKRLTADKFNQELNYDLTKSCWIDGLQRKVKVREAAINELRDHCENMKTNNNGEDISGFQEMYELIINLEIIYTHTIDELDEEQIRFSDFAYTNLIYKRKKEENHLPIPVYSFIKPSNGIRFLTHILLSQGEFSTEIDLMTHQTIRDCFRHANLIGEENTTEALQEYSNKLLAKYIKEQL